MTKYCRTSDSERIGRSSFLLHRTPLPHRSFCAVPQIFRVKRPCPLEAAFLTPLLAHFLQIIAHTLRYFPGSFVLRHSSFVIFYTLPRFTGIGFPDSSTATRVKTP